MAGFKERAEQLRKGIATLKASRPEDAIASGFNAATLVKARIQRRGEDHLGKSYKPYTSDYARYGRRALGYQDNYVDYSRTGKFFASWGVFVRQEGVDSVTVGIQADNAKDQAKAAGMAKHRGIPYRLSEKETKLVIEDFAERRRDRYKEI